MCGSPEIWQRGQVQEYYLNRDLNESPQRQILEMIQARGHVQSREFIREIWGWDHRKAISRLIRKGYPIKNVSPQGQEAVYVWLGD